MLRAERQAKIINLIRDQGFVENDELSRMFGVTGATIRRDLKDLAEQKLIQLDHGGAYDISYLRGSMEPLYHTKMILNIEQKREIGAHAVRHVENSDTIILDSGTTTLQIAKNLKGGHFSNLTVITYDIRIANELCTEPNITVIVLGGILRRSLYSLYGPFTQSNLMQLRASKTFLATDGATRNHGILNSNLEEVPIKKLIVDNSDFVLLVADASKFGKDIPFKVCDWNSIHKVITDDGIGDEYLEFFSSNEIDIDLVEL